MVTVPSVPAFHDDGIVAFAVLGEGGVKLGKTLQAGQLVKHRPVECTPDVRQRN
jgi:hypothetical protein